MDALSQLNVKISFELKNGTPVVSSRTVATIFEKRHDNILRDIDALLNFEDSSTQEWFFASSYKDPSGKSNREYFMTRDGFSLLAMGFNSKKALQFKVAFIKRFNEMERRLNGGVQTMNFVSETDLFRVIANSKMDYVTSLEKWIYDTAVAVMHGKNSKADRILEDRIVHEKREVPIFENGIYSEKKSMTPAEFLQAIFHAAQDQFTYIWSRTNSNQRKRTNSFKTSDIDSLLNTAQSLNKDQLNVSFSMGLIDHPLGTYQRAKSIDIVAIPCLWIDIDVDNPVHGQSQKLVPSIEEAIQVLPAELPPSIIVNSGYGIHAYWIFDSLFEIKSDSDRKRAKSMLERLQSLIRSNAGEYFIDQTADLSRMLRLPGTINWKSGNKNDAPICKVIEASSKVFRVVDVERTLNDLTLKTIPKTENPRQISDSQREFIDSKFNTSGNEFQSISGDLSAIIEHCSAVNFFVENVEVVASYESMKYILPIILHCGDGYQFAMNLCKRWLGSKFDFSKTQAQIDGLKKLKPATCESIRRSGLQCSYNSCLVCQAGKHSPIAILNSPVVRRKIFGDISGTIGEVFPDAPDNIAIFESPDGFVISENGIDFETEKSVVKTAFTPFVISRLITSEGSAGDESIIFWELTRRIGEGDWRSRLVSTKIINKIPEFAVALLESNIGVDASQARLANKYLVAFKEKNKSNIARIELIEKLGWRDDFRFIHPEFQFDDSGNELYKLTGSSITDHIRQHGTFDDALDLWKSAKLYPFARLLFVAQLAAPLLRWTGCRNFTLYLWGQSQSGKTAALVGANSIWGDADFMADFNSTMKSLIDLAIERNDLPTNINEWQLVDERNKRDIANKLLRGNESGKSRGKLRRDGTQIPKKEFNGITIATGEVPMTGADAKHGEKTRILEIRVDGVVGEFKDGNFYLDDETCEKFYTNHRDKNTYGILGIEWIKFLQSKLKTAGAQFFKYAYHLTYTQLKKIYPDHQESHLQYVSLFTITDVLAAELFDKLDEEQAMDDTNEWIQFLVPLIETKNQIRDADRARDLIADWYNVNEAYFEDPVERVKVDIDKEIVRKKQFRRLGYITNDAGGTHIWAIPAELRDYLKKQGFDPDAIIRALAESGDVEVDLVNNLPSIVKRIEGKPRRVIGLKFITKTQDSKEEEEDIPLDQIPW